MNVVGLSPSQEGVGVGVFELQGGGGGGGVVFGHQKPKNSALRTPKRFCQKFIKISISS